MSLLGNFLKQPIEIEIYSIQFAKDLSSTDELTAAWQILSSEVADPWDQEVKTNSYTVVDTDNERILVTTSSIVLISNPSEGFRFYVANKNQTGSITIGSFNLPARGAVALAYKSGVWIEEAKIEGTLVNALQDQRVRTRFSKGKPFEVYKVQVAVDTAEGRTLQDEFNITIEEV